MKKHSKKPNPNKRPATMADVNRAKNNATIEAMHRSLLLVLFVLIDKHNAPYEDIQQFAEEINYYADSIAKGYVRWPDIERVVEDEYDVHLAW